MNNDGYESVELGNGQVIQAGLYSPSVRPNRVMGFITRAIVLKTYYEDDPGWGDRGWAKDFVRGIFCDVRTYGVNGTRHLSRVPFLQRVQGLWDEDIYIPRGSSQNIDGGDLNTEEGLGVPLTPAHSLDGDHVLVAFLESDISQPVILPFMLPHPGTERRITEDSGRVRSIRHQGSIISIDKQGAVKIDTRGCAKPSLGPGGSEESSQGDGGGEISITGIDADGALVSIDIRQDGSIEIVNGGHEFIELAKSTGSVAINAQQNFQLTAPVVTITATGGVTIAGPVAISGALAVTPGPGGSISLGGSAPLVSHTAWQAPWTALMGVLTAQMAIYGAPVPPPTVSVADYALLITNLMAVATAFSATATVKTTAG